MIKNRPDIILRPYTWKGEQFVTLSINGESTRLRADWSTIEWLQDKLECEMKNNHEVRNPDYYDHR